MHVYYTCVATLYHYYLYNALLLAVLQQQSVVSGFIIFALYHSNIVGSKPLSDRESAQIERCTCNQGRFVKKKRQQHKPIEACITTGCFEGLYPL